MKLDKTVREDLISKIAGLRERPEDAGKQLRLRPQAFVNRQKHMKHCPYWSLRAGDYRAIYSINGKEGRVNVLFVGHRKDVYDDFSKLFLFLCA